MVKNKYLLNSLIGITLLLVLFSFMFIIHDAKVGITGMAVGSFEGEEYPSVFLDVGIDGGKDVDSSKDIFLILNEDVSNKQEEESITYRTLNESSFFYLKIKTDSLDFLAGNGVPYKDAILEINYKDVIDETNCYSYSSNLANCRSRVETKLNFGTLEYLILKGLGGLNDKQWKTQQIFIENTPWQTLRSIDGYFTFRIYYPKQFAWHEPLPIDYINFSFVSEEDFDNIREAERVSRGLIRKEFVETITINSDNYPKNYVLYSRNYLEKVYPNSIPRAEEILSGNDAKLTAFEIAGNKEPITFAIYAFEQLQNARVSITDLTKGNAKISADNVKIEKVVYLDKRWWSSINEYYGVNPWYLDTFNSLNINANSNQQVWLTISAPKNTEPGTYNGTITVSGANIQSSVIPVSIEVFNIELEKPDATPYLYSSPYYYPYSNPRDVAAQDMAEHDINPIIIFEPSIQRNSNEPTAPTYSVDFREWRYGNELTQLKSFGILPQKTRVTIQDNYKDLWEWVYGNKDYFIRDSTQFDTIYKDILEQYKDFFNNYGVELTVTFEDEPGMKVSKRVHSNHMNRLAKEVGIETWVTYHPNCETPLTTPGYSEEDLGPMDPYLDDRVYHISWMNKEEIEKTLNSGDKFSYYTTYSATQPVITNNRFLNGIYASASGATGVYVYAYGDWFEQPYDDMDNHYNSDVGNEIYLRGHSRYELVLPSWEPKVYDTVVFEAAREGIEDSKIIATLRKAIAENPGEKAEEAQQYLNDLFSSSRLDRDNYSRYYYCDSNKIETQIEEYADRSENILQDLSGDPENFDYFDDIRKDMISYILQLTGKFQNQTCSQAGFTCRASCLTNETQTSNSCTTGVCCKPQTIEQTCEDAGYYCVTESNCSLGNRRNYECSSGVCCSKLPTIINDTIRIQQDKTCAEQNGRFCNSSQYCNGSIGWASDGNCCLGECVEEVIDDGDEEKPNNYWLYGFIGGIIALIFGVIGYILYEVNRGRW